MTDEIKNDDVVEDIKDLTPEEQAVAWEKWVREEVNTALDLYLPLASSGHINVKYNPLILEELESGPVYDKDKITAVLLSLIFEFTEPIKIDKIITKND